MFKNPLKRKPRVTHYDDAYVAPTHAMEQAPHPALMPYRHPACRLTRPRRHGGRDGGASRLARKKSVRRDPDPRAISGWCSGLTCACRPAQAQVYAQPFPGPVVYAMPAPGMVPQMMVAQPYGAYYSPQGHGAAAQRAPAPWSDVDEPIYEDVTHDPSSRAIAERFAPNARPNMHLSIDPLPEPELPRAVPHQAPVRAEEPQSPRAPEAPAKPSRLTGLMPKRPAAPRAYKRPDPAMLKRTQKPETGERRIEHRAPRHSPPARRRARRFRRQGRSARHQARPRGDALRTRNRTRHQDIPHHGACRRHRPLDERQERARVRRPGTQCDRHRTAQSEARLRGPSRTSREPAFTKTDAAFPWRSAARSAANPSWPILLACRISSSPAPRVPASPSASCHDPFDPLRMTPDECRFLMIDPKDARLSVYNGIPHLLCRSSQNRRRPLPP